MTHLSRLALASTFAILGFAAITNAATDDRAYRLGDDSQEGASVGITVGSGGANVAPGFTLDSQGPSGKSAYLDIGVQGAPVYVAVTDRPDGQTGLGASFAGTGSGQFLRTPTSMSSPNGMWNNDTFFPGTPFGLNYSTILSHGIQAWVKPTDTGARADVVIDTVQNGIYISAGDRWGLQFANGSIDSTTAVAYGQWSHVMQLSGANDPKGGHSNAEGVLLVNGVAVVASAGLYDNSEASLSIAGSETGTNLYGGTIDDVHIFLWGDNSFANSGDGRVGQNWGALNLAVTNQWIAWKLQQMGITDPGDVNLSGGLPNAADVTSFVANYNSQRIVGGIRVGDWTSRQQGDLNYDGIVDLKDAFILNDALIAGTGTGLDFGLLTSVPEPATATLFATLLLAGAMRRGKRVC